VLTWIIDACDRRESSLCVDCVAKLMAWARARRIGSINAWYRRRIVEVG